MEKAAWIAVDWGTSRLRAWAMQGDQPFAAAESDAGMNHLTRDGFEPALLALIEPWLGDGVTEVICCGMAGSRQGWAEAPYMAVPCKPASANPSRAATRDPRLSVAILPGVSQAEPPDVMRGEETQIAGFLRLNTGWDGVICLPGTHSKWVHVSAGEIISFRTFMTGELYGLLADASVLRHSVGGEDWDAAAFETALSDTIARPANLAAGLFRLRASHLLDGTEAGIGRARLSGLLIGAELAAARPYWLGQEVVVVGAGPLAARYVQALGTLAVEASIAKADTMTIAGLTAAHRALKAMA